MPAARASHTTNWAGDIAERTSAVSCTNGKLPVTSSACAIAAAHMPAAAATAPRRCTAEAYGLEQRWLLVDRHRRGEARVVLAHIAYPVSDWPQPNRPGWRALNSVAAGWVAPSAGDATHEGTRPQRNAVKAGRPSRATIAGTSLVGATFQSAPGSGSSTSPLEMPKAPVMSSTERADA